MARLTLHLLWITLLASNIANGQHDALVSDPVVDIQPMREKLEARGSETDAAVRRLPTQRWDEEVDVRSASQAYYKRDVEGNQISIPSEVLHEQREAEEDNTITGGQQCAYTFIVPQQPPPTSHVCVNTRGSQQGNVANQFFTELHRDVIAAKSEVLQIRDEIIDERQKFASLSAVESMQDAVSLLQQESRNMDSRVAQLYLQMMHEIINKRDDSIEISQLRNKLLNQTVKYHELKEEHEQLVREHNALRAEMSEQSEAMQSLQESVQELSALVRSQSTSRNTVQQSQAITSDPLMTVRRQSAFSSATSRREVEIITRPPATTTVTTTPLLFSTGPFRDCSEVQRAGYTTSGIFNLRLPGLSKRIRVWCDFEQDPGGWIVIQRRTGKRLNFYRNMASYKKGFGKLHSDFWLGLENIYKLTSQPGINYKLHIDMEDWHGRKTFVEYQSFRVEGEDTGYKLRITHYSGNAGDSLTWHNNMRFTTLDVDNDQFARNCAHYHRGGWWYNTCAHSNLNGKYYRGGYYTSQYQDGIYWSEWRGGSYSLKSVSMKLRPTE